MVTTSHRKIAISRERSTKCYDRSGHEPAWGSGTIHWGLKDRSSFPVCGRKTAAWACDPKVADNQDSMPDESRLLPRPSTQDKLDKRRVTCTWRILYGQVAIYLCMFCGKSANFSEKKNGHTREPRPRWPYALLHVGPYDLGTLNAD